MRINNILETKGIKLYHEACFTFLFLLALSFSATAQTKVISGNVMAQEDKVPLIGVTVLIQGTAQGTTTDVDGNFNLEVEGSEVMLQFSYTGFKPETIKVTDQTIINVVMKTDAAIMDEVVVVGYGTVKKSDLTGAVTKVTEKDFNGGIVSSPDQLIQGRAAGVQVISSSGQPGAANTVRIRGNSSIRSGNEPLYVVDGIQITATSGKPGASNAGISSSPSSNPLSYLNPSDIQSVEILKDASATAIYGSRGSNGVIIITTKKGKTGRPTLEFNSSLGLSTLLNAPDHLSASEYREALKTYDRPDGDFGGNADAFDEITRDVALTNNHSVSIGSASDRGSYRVSLGYFDQEGIIANSRLNRINASISGSYKFLESEKLGLDVNLIVSKVEEKTPPIGQSSGAGGSLISTALAWNPTQDFYDEDGEIFQLGQGSLSSPVALLEGFSDNSNQTNIISKFSPSYKITDNLIYKMDLAYNKISGSRRGYGQRWVQSGDILNRGFAYINTLDQSTSILTHTLNFNKEINDDLSMSLLAGYEWQRSAFEFNNVSARDFPLDFADYTGYVATTPAFSREISSNVNPIEELQSFFGRANFNYKGRYLLTATFRADGSNKFGENNKYGYFPSVAFAWNVANEAFLENSPFSNLKLRASWGQTGNQSFPAGAAGERWRLANNGNGISLQNAPNPSLKWETTASTNIGVDFGILQDRITGSIEYFNNNTSDLLFESPVIFPGPENARVWTNLSDATVINKGFEVTLNANVITTNKLNWSVGVNAAFIQNEVNDFVGAIDYGQLYGQGLSGVLSQRLEAGQPLNSFYLPVFTGTDADGVDQFKTDSEGLEVKEFVGDANPDAVVGITTSVDYGKWSANLNFNGTFGNQILYNTGMSVTNISNIGFYNIAESQNGFNTVNVPKASSKYLFDGDYLRLSNATISYNAGNFKAFRNIQFYVTGTNLLTFTEYIGSDPEVNTVNSANGLPSSGIEYEAYPSSRTFLIGTRFSL